MCVGENIKRFRLARGWTQQKLADMVCVSRPLITQVERGSKKPSKALVQDLANVMECREEDLYAGCEE